MIPPRWYAWFFSSAEQARGFVNAARALGLAVDRYSACEVRVLVESPFALDVAIMAHAAATVPL